MTMDEHSETPFEFERLRSERKLAIESWTYRPKGDDPDEDRLVQEYVEIYNFVALETSRCFQLILDGEYATGDKIVIVDITHLVKQNENKVLPIEAKNRMGHIGFYMSPKSGRGGYSNKIIGRTKTPPSPKGGRYYWGTTYRGNQDITDKHIEYMESIVELLEKNGEKPYRIKIDPDELGKRHLDSTTNPVGVEDEETRKNERYERLAKDIKRNPELSKRIKELYEDKCFICGNAIRLKHSSYSEAAHIKPLGGKHDGPDECKNMIVLCPNHHIEFDFGVVTIDPKTLKVVHRDEENPFSGRRVTLRHELNKAHLEYHYREIFNKQ